MDKLMGSLRASGADQSVISAARSSMPAANVWNTDFKEGRLKERIAQVRASVQAALENGLQAQGVRLAKATPAKTVAQQAATVPRDESMFR
jgi:hypothetical protein